jgi:hypothetical protein
MFPNQGKVRFTEAIIGREYFRRSKQSVTAPEERGTRRHRDVPETSAVESTRAASNAAQRASGVKGQL